MKLCGRSVRSAQSQGAPCRAPARSASPPGEPASRLPLPIRSRGKPAGHQLLPATLSGEPAGHLPLPSSLSVEPEVEQPLPATLSGESAGRLPLPASLPGEAVGKLHLPSSLPGEPGGRLSLPGSLPGEPAGGVPLRASLSPPLDPLHRRRVCASVPPPRFSQVRPATLMSYFFASPPATPLFVVPVALAGALEYSSSSITSQNVSMVSGILRELVTALPLEGVDTGGPRPRSSPPSRRRHVSPSTHPRPRRVPSQSSFGTIETQPRCAQCGVSQRQAAAEPMRRWLGSVRALRDSHVRLVARQLRHINRLNRALDHALQPLLA